MADYTGMQILSLQDGENNTPLSSDFQDKLRDAAVANGHGIHEVSLIQGDVEYCYGCLRSWSSESAACVVRDRIESLETMLADCHLIVIISPVIFGTFSLVMKSAPASSILHEGTGADGCRPPRVIRSPDRYFCHTIERREHQSATPPPVEVLRTLATADGIVFAFPLHAYTVPAALTRLLEDFHSYTGRTNVRKRRCRVYAFVNSGFPVPEVNAEAMRVMKLFW